ncbi:MAG: bifunctional protein HldE [Gammaproteobacteria bacterium]|nr:MAG: bifunctional protein HldE [Gammaproteobacteria bacterium]
MIIELPDFSRARVLVVGDPMLDRYWYGPTARVSPEAPVPVVAVAASEERVGGAANVALNVRALGGTATVLGFIGEDEAGARLEALLAAGGVQSACLRVPGHATVTKLRVVSRQQQLIRLDFEDGFTAGDGAALLARARKLLAEHDVLVLSDYGKGTLADAPALIEAARAAGKPVLIDPKGRDFERYRGADLLTPNLSEFEAVAGSCADEAELCARGEALRARLGLGALLVTRSEKGMTLLAAGAAPLDLPAQAREVYDVTGAGDTVIATLAAALAAGAALPDATALANYAAGVVVGKLGTATASVEELRAAMWAHAPLGRGVVDVDTLLQRLAAARALGERIVFTNGCFDILHAGHVAYLQQARRLGDRLVVAVNDDDSVRRLKGAGRPVNPLAQRMAVLAALECVDWVVPFSEDTPAALIDKAAPDVLVKGGDYRPETIAGADAVRARGGRVVVLDYVEGCSTSAILERLERTR